MEKIEIKNLTKKYGDYIALSNVCLNIDKFGHYLFVGPDGAGLTTLLEILAGVEEYEGSVTIDGAERKDLKNEALSISYVPDKPIFLRGSVLKNLKYITKICGKNYTDEDLCKKAQEFGLNPKQNVKRLSYIEKLFLCLVRIDIKNSEIVLLDFSKNLENLPIQCGAFTMLIEWLNKFSGILILAENGQNLAPFIDAKIFNFNFGVNLGNFSAQSELENPTTFFNYILANKMHGSNYKVYCFDVENLKCGFSVTSSSNVKIPYQELLRLVGSIEDFDYNTTRKFLLINDYMFDELTGSCLGEVNFS